MFKRLQVFLHPQSRYDRIQLRLMDRRSGLSDHIVRMGETEVGKMRPLSSAGLARSIRQIQAHLEAAHALKRPESMPCGEGLETPHESISYQGDNKALSIILQAREDRLAYRRRVMDARQLELALEAVSAFFKWEHATP